MLLAVSHRAEVYYFSEVQVIRSVFIDSTLDVTYENFC